MVLRGSEYVGGGLAMPIFEYICGDCGAKDKRVAGIDDRFAICVSCGGLMIRLDEDVFKPDSEYGAERNQQ